TAGGLRLMGDELRRTGAVAMLWLLCVVYPWINPVAGGPSVSVQPWLATAICATLLFAMRGWTVPRFPLPMWLAVAGLLSALRSLPALDTLAFLGALLLIVAMAGVVHGDERQAFTRVVATAWLGAALVSSAMALLQYFGAGEAFAPWVSHAPLGEG